MKRGGFMTFGKLRFVLVGAMILLVGAAEAKTRYVFGNITKMGPDRYAVSVNGAMYFLSEKEVTSLYRSAEIKEPANSDNPDRPVLLDSPENLKGRYFESDHENSSEAMDWLRVMGEKKGDYKVPSDAELKNGLLFDEIAKGFAAGKCPDLKKFDSNTTYKGLSAAYSEDSSDMCGGFKADFLKSFGEKLRVLDSSLRVSEDTPRELNGMTSNCARYFLVMKNGKPVHKFSLEKAANGFACSSDSKEVSKRPEDGRARSGRDSRTKGNNPYVPPIAPKVPAQD